MKAALLIAVLFSVACSTGQARLGETPQQIEARYGKPVKVCDDKEMPWSEYEKNGFKIMALYLSGTCAHLEIKRANGAKLSEEEVQAALLANQAESQWVVDGESSEYSVIKFRGWKRRDGQADAAFILNETFFMVSTTKYSRFCEERQAREKKEVREMF